MADKKTPTFITPAGVAVYPHLTKPDYKFKKDTGEFHVKLRLPADAEIKVGEEMTSLRDFVESERDKAVAKAKAENKGKKIKAADMPIADEVDDNGNETGFVLYNFKMPHKVKSKKGEGEIFELLPRIFDAKGNVVKPKSIFGGSELKIAFQVWPFYTALVGAGVTLKLRAVQILKLIAATGGDAKSYGFGEEEGYTAEETSDEDAPFDTNGKDEESEF